MEEFRVLIVYIQFQGWVTENGTFYFGYLFKQNLTLIVFHRPNHGVWTME